MKLLKILGSIVGGFLSVIAGFVLLAKHSDKEDYRGFRIW